MYIIKYIFYIYYIIYYIYYIVYYMYIIKYMLYYIYYEYMYMIYINILYWYKLSYFCFTLRLLCSFCGNFSATFDFPISRFPSRESDFPIKKTKIYFQESVFPSPFSRFPENLISRFPEKRTRIHGFTGNEREIQFPFGSLFWSMDNIQSVFLFFVEIFPVKP